MRPASSLLDTYSPAAGLPPLAGITDFANAARRGLSVEECVNRHKRHHWALRRLHEIFINRLTAEPLYELKMVFSLHVHLCAEHVAALRERVAEMREPPLGLDAAPSAALDVFFDEVLAAPDTAALVLGVYELALPALVAGLRRYQLDTNRLVDNPSWRVNRFALIEVEEMASYGEAAVKALVTAERRAELQGWLALLRGLLVQAGSLDGVDGGGGGVPERMFSGKAPVYDGTPRRDERFPDPYNMGVHAEVFLYDEAMPTLPKTLMLYYKRLREIDVPEMMASILAESAGKPWDYRRDMTRQLWDEARHAMMGEVGFVQAGVDWRRFVRVNFTWSLALNTQLKPLERHAVLYYIEQGLMPKTGKRYEWETAIASGESYAATIQDFDWADEVLHARIGRDWYVKAMGDPKRAIDYGDECWSRVLIDWRSYITAGHTRHENWWPATYGEWCRVQGAEPDAKVLAYDTSYEASRADLKDLSASA